MCLLHVNPFLLRLRSEIRHRFPPAAHRLPGVKICRPEEDLLYDGMHGVYLWVWAFWLQGEAFAARAVRSVVTFLGSGSHVASASQHSKRRRNNSLGSIFNCPGNHHPSEAGKKKAFHLWSSCSSMQCPSRVHLASSVCVCACVLWHSNTCVCYFLIYVHADIQRLTHARWKLPVRKSNSSRGVSLLHVFSDEIGGGASWSCQRPPECAIVDMCVCVCVCGPWKVFRKDIVSLCL